MRKGKLAKGHLFCCLFSHPEKGKGRIIAPFSNQDWCYYQLVCTRLMLQPMDLVVFGSMFCPLIMALMASWR